MTAIDTSRSLAPVAANRIVSTMHNVLKHILEQKHQELSAMAVHKDTALVSFRAAEAAQKRLRENGEPY